MLADGSRHEVIKYGTRKIYTGNDKLSVKKKLLSS